MRWLLFIAVLVGLLEASPVLAVTPAEDIATTILLRGYDCGGRQVHDIEDRTRADGSRVILATCPNGVRYRIEITADGRVRVSPER